MSRIKRARPSPAIMVAVIALVTALGGSAVAEVATTSLSNKATKKVKRTAKKQAKKQDQKQDKRNFPVDSSQIGDGVVTQAKIAGGLLPKAWANVSPFGTIKSGKGIAAADITPGDPGVYCFDGVSGTTALASGSYFAAPGPTTAHVLDAAAAALIGGFVANGCAASTAWMVITTKGDGGEVLSDFTIAFFG